MIIARVLAHGSAHVGVVLGDNVCLIETDPLQYPEADVAALLRAHSGLPSLCERTIDSGPRIPLADARLLAPVVSPRKIVAIGRNYASHTTEEGSSIPAEPLVFAKFPSAIIGPGEQVRWDPQLTNAVDFEAELAVVIGKAARCVPLDNALDHVFGYTCLNDVSARDLQDSDGQWVRAKSLDTFCPMGPWIVTSDEVPDPQGLTINCRIADDVMQQASTAEMLFGVADLIHRLSWWFTLEPGDIIATGTPEGTGYFRHPRRLLQHGDVVTVSISRVGTLRNPVDLHDPVASEGRHDAHPESLQSSQDPT